MRGHQRRIYGYPEAAGHDRRVRVNVSQWTLDPGNVCPTAGLERDLGQQAGQKRPSWRSV
jgi:hypothetical protein